MKNDWMIDALTDLRQFALKNYYISLAEQIDDAIVVAAVELRAHGDAGADTPATQKEQHA